MIPVVHFEVYASDSARAQAFYSDVFGWKITIWDNGGVQYRMVTTVDSESAVQGKPAPGINGGIVPRVGELPQEGQPVNAYVCTMEVDDLDSYLTRVENAGGSVAVPKRAIPLVGWIAYCNDTEGNMFGLLQNDRNAR